MIDLDFIERLISAIDNSGIDSLEIERGGTRVRLSKTPSTAPAPATLAAAAAPIAHAGPAAPPAPGATRASEPAAPPSSRSLPARSASLEMNLGSYFWPIWTTR